MWMQFGLQFGVHLGVPFGVHFGVHFGKHFDKHFGVYFGRQFGVHFGVLFWFALTEYMLRTVLTGSHFKYYEENVLTERCLISQYIFN